MTTQTLTRADYNTKRRHDYAGTITTREPETVQVWREVYPDWDGKHWAMFGTQRGGVALAPINIRN
ncbi:hypothetical protein [Nocardia wallacei]|uniref:Uncharacterized protein n=1 Tax=Nocardia wallacei TaxID=480035 RepID=A0A7G1KWK7_9NOCA|nr:hypothetical protein [Nocardia wallacei]BCK59452.1 hypothetical protein NWFMUON74_72240 [Nocardia wallacei]